MALPSILFSTRTPQAHTHMQTLTINLSIHLLRQPRTSGSSCEPSGKPSLITARGGRIAEVDRR